jgi:hypothetical protein
MAARPRVVVAGAGLLGRALADDRPGLVFRTDADRTLTEFAKDTAAKYGGLDGQWCFNPVGSLDLATTRERLADLKRRHGWATSWGVRGYLRSPREWSTTDLSAEETYVGDVPVVALRLSTVAEPGWEPHTTADLGHAIAYAWLPLEYGGPGTPVEIEYFGERVPGSVA